MKNEIGDLLQSFNGIDLLSTFNLKEINNSYIVAHDQS